MNKYLLFFLLLCSFLGCLAQDVIVKRDGATVLCQIVRVSPTEVVYLKWSDLNGPQYIMDSSLVSIINYQDGRQDKLNEQNNIYTPGNQQTGDAQYNDNALLALDFYKYNGTNEQKARKLTTIGWIVGGAGVGIGTILMIVSGTVGNFTDANIGLFAGGAFLFLGGVATTTGCLIKAHQLRKESQFFSYNPLYHYDFNFIDGTSLSAGIDLIHNNKTHNFIPGFGLQFNF